MPAVIGNEFTSFNAATILNQGNQSCLLGTNLPSIYGLTFSGVSSSYSGNQAQIALQGWPTIVNNNVESIVDGNVITLYGQGLGQLLVGWNNQSEGGVGKHSSMYVRNKGSDANSGWSNWYEILDSYNFTKYIATYEGEGATGTWGINITGYAAATQYLLPRTLTGTYGPATYNFLPNSSDILIWSEAFNDSSLHYTANGEQHEYTDTGDICMILVPDATSDNLELNIAIDGTFIGHFKGNLEGIATKANNANISTGTNTLAYYDNALGHFNYTPDIHYLTETLVSAESGINRTSGRINGLEIHADATYNSMLDVISYQNNILSYGDAGPQIRFTVGNSTKAVILFNDHTETAGSYPSFHFLGQSVTTSNDITTTAPLNVVIKSAGLVAHERATIGAQVLDTSYVFSVTGASGFYSNINMINSIIHFSNGTQYIEWFDTENDRIVNNEQIYGTGLKRNGIGTYTDNSNLILNISNWDGIHITTDSANNLYHNGNIIPAGASDTIGSATNPVYITGGIIQATTYSLSATISGGAANRLAYYNTATSIDDAAHFVNNSKIAINETTEQTEALYVNGTTRITDNVTIGSTGNKSIIYKGSQISTTMIQFVDNSTNENGNGLLIGGGGLVAIGAGESASATNVLGVSGITSETETLYLLSDGAVNIEAGAETFANRVGIQITSTGHVLPVLTESVHTNAQNLGSSTARWAKLYVGTADTYGSNTQPIYWNAGVPTALTYTINRLYYGESQTSFTYTGHYVSTSKLAINYQNEPTQNFYVNGTAYISGAVTLNGNLLPSTTETQSLGSGGANGVRWAKLYIGDIDSYGGTAKPIYWNNGVPEPISATVGGTATPVYLNSGLISACSASIGNAYVPVYMDQGEIKAVSMVQKVNFSFDQNNKSVKITHNTDTNAFTANSIVLSIVVTEGHANLTSPITWTSAAGYIALNVATAVSNAVQGYVLIANGVEVANASVTLTKSNSNV